MYQKIIGKKIFIAVGHGGKDPGAVKDNIVEAFCNLEVAEQMGEELRRHGFQVKLSRYQDEDDPLREEIAQCNAYRPDLAIAVHTNAGGGSGFEVFYQSTRSWENMKQSEKLARFMDKKVRDCFLSGSRGVKTRRDLGWLNEVQAPAILCENFFVDGPKADYYSQKEQLRTLGKVYAIAVLDYFGVPHSNCELQMLHYSVIQPDQTRKDYQCMAVLQQGNWYVPLRQSATDRNMDVYYDESLRRPVVFDPVYYTHQEFAQGLIRLSDFHTKEEAILSGLTEEEMAGYYFEEYD